MRYVQQHVHNLNINQTRNKGEIVKSTYRRHVPAITQVSVLQSSRVQPISNSTSTCTTPWRQNGTTCPLSQSQTQAAAATTSMQWLRLCHKRAEHDTAVLSWARSGARSCLTNLDGVGLVPICEATMLGLVFRYQEQPE